MRRFLAAAALALLLVVALAGGFLFFLVRRNLPSTESARLAGLSSRVAVAFDDRGVATVTAATWPDAFRAQGWLTARERLFQLEMQRRFARGELAEVFGRPLLSSDRLRRTYGFSRVAEEAVRRMPENERRDLEALADGINAWTGAHAGRLGLEFALLRLSPRRFTPADSAAIHLMMAEDLSTSWRRDVALGKLARVAPGARAFVTDTVSKDDVLIVPDAAPHVFPALPRGAGEPVPSAVPPRDEETRGSNAWAVSGARTASGRPLLASDPHLFHSIPGIWLPMRFVVAGRLVEGVTLPGIPGVVIGRNDRLAWGMTTLRADVQDLFRETIVDRRAKRGDAWERVEERTETIAVRGARPETVTVRATSHGPLVEGSLALKWIALDPALLRIPVAAVMTAGDGGALDRALDSFPFPAHNVVWAAADGAIGWRAAGLVPVRRPGTDGSVPYDGSDAANDWTGYVPPAAMPRISNPQNGFVVTANQRDVGTAFPHVVTTDWPSTQRARRIAQLLAESADAGRKIDRAAAEAIQLDEVSLALRETMAAAAPELPEPWAARFGRWDGRAEASSSAFLAARTFRRKLVERALSAWHVPPQAGLPEARVLDLVRASDGDLARAGLGGRHALVRGAWDAAVKDLAARWGEDPARWTWGEANRLAVRHPLGRVPGLSWLFDPPSFPQSGGPGTPRVATAAEGQSMRFVVDWGRPEEATLVVPFGVSGHVGSPHRTDQLAAWRAGDGDGRKTRLARPAVSGMELLP